MKKIPNKLYKYRNMAIVSGLLLLIMYVIDAIDFLPFMFYELPYSIIAYCLSIEFFLFTVIFLARYFIGKPTSSDYSSRKVGFFEALLYVIGGISIVFVVGLFILSFAIGGST